MNQLDVFIASKQASKQANYTLKSNNYQQDAEWGNA